MCCWGWRGQKWPETKQGGSCSLSCCFYPCTQWALPVCPCHQAPCAQHRDQGDGLCWDLTQATDQVWILGGCITGLPSSKLKKKVFPPLSYPHHGNGG